MYEDFSRRLGKVLPDFGNVAEVEERGLTVQDDAKVTSMEGGRNSGVVNGDVDSYGEGRFGANEEFYFITFELEEVLLRRCCYSREAGFDVG